MGHHHLEHTHTHTAVVHTMHNSSETQHACMHSAPAQALRLQPSALSPSPSLRLQPSALSPQPQPQPQRPPRSDPGRHPQTSAPALSPSPSLSPSVHHALTPPDNPILYLKSKNPHTQALFGELNIESAKQLSKNMTKIVDFGTHFESILGSWAILGPPWDLKG